MLEDRILLKQDPPLLVAIGEKPKSIFCYVDAPSAFTLKVIENCENANLTL